MHAAATGTGASTAFDGEVDAGLEQPGAGTERSAEVVAHALLRLVGEHPGRMGRLRAARLVGGYAVALREDEDAAELGRYAVRVDWNLRELTRLVDALLDGRLMAQTPGPRPVLVLTRAGHRTLEALEAGDEPVPARR